MLPNQKQIASHFGKICRISSTIRWYLEMNEGVDKSIHSCNDFNLNKSITALSLSWFLFLYRKASISTRKIFTIFYYESKYTVKFFIQKFSQPTCTKYGHQMRLMCTKEMKSAVELQHQRVETRRNTIYQANYIVECITTAYIL